MFNLVGSNPHHKETDKIMTDKIFNLLNQINREGIDNGTWGVAEGIDDTRSYFGTIETENRLQADLHLHGSRGLLLLCQAANGRLENESR